MEFGISKDGIKFFGTFQVIIILYFDFESSLHKITFLNSRKHYKGLSLHVTYSMNVLLFIYKLCSVDIIK